MTAYKQQVGGSHYKGMKVQPLEFGYLNQYDGAIYSAIKYVSRHRAKDGKEGLKKARHCVLFRLEMVQRYGAVYGVERMPMTHYISENEIAGLDATVLLRLNEWGMAPRNSNVDDHEHPACANLIVALIDTLISETYPEDSQ